MRRHDFGTNDICKHCGIPAAATGASGSECSRSDAATQAFDAIASACGCPEWEYPGQVVRDVLAVVRQRDDLQRRLEPRPGDFVGSVNGGAATFRLRYGAGATVTIDGDDLIVRLEPQPVLADLRISVAEPDDDEVPERDPRNVMHARLADLRDAGCGHIANALRPFVELCTDAAGADALRARIEQFGPNTPKCSRVILRDLVDDAEAISTGAQFFADGFDTCPVCGKAFDGIVDHAICTARR